ncbi:MAG: hypothetical protein KAU06_01405 [Candidatus Marinimicrobia bacterium]|nr:hypothetical protein [Candidatus Neomarinimicrobiota bacterium]
MNGYENTSQFGRAIAKFKGKELPQSLCVSIRKVQKQYECSGFVMVNSGFAMLRIVYLLITL